MHIGRAAKEVGGFTTGPNADGTGEAREESADACDDGPVAGVTGESGSASESSEAAGEGGEGRGQHQGRLDQLERLADELRHVEIEHLRDEQLRTEVAAIERVSRRLEARAARIAAALTRREAMRARRQAGGDPRAGERAARRERQRLADELRWTHSQAKRAVQLGDGFDSPEADEAFDEGRLPARHAALLADTLRWIEDPDVRVVARERLLAAAGDQDAVSFGRTCRGVLAELDHDGAAEAARRRRARQSARIWQTEDGMQALSGQWSGLDGETIATAIHAFRRPDAQGENRRPEQVTAQAVVDLAKAALKAGEAPNQHGIRPHVIVAIDWETILKQAGRADATWSGPLTFDEIRAMLADAGVSRLLVGAKGVPTEAGEETRTVPAGLYRSLLVRDGGCIADGCDVPAAWCQVMHLATPYRLKGRLTLTTAALGCSFHHNMFDRLGWEITWIDGRPVLHPPNGSPRPRQRHDTSRTTPPPAGDRGQAGAEEAAPAASGASMAPATARGEEPSVSETGLPTSGKGRPTGFPDDGRLPGDGDDGRRPPQDAARRERPSGARAREAASDPLAAGQRL